MVFDLEEWRSLETKRLSLTEKTKSNSRIQSSNEQHLARLFESGAGSQLRHGGFVASFSSWWRCETHFASIFVSSPNININLDFSSFHLYSGKI